MVNYLAILVVSVVSFLIGWIWYGPLFGKVWMKYMKFGKKEINDSKKKGMAKSMILNFIATFVTAWVLAVLIGLIGGESGGAIYTGFLVWVGFYLTTGLGSVLWENKPVGLYVLNSAYWLVIILIMSTILGIWV